MSEARNEVEELSKVLLLGHTDSRSVKIAKAMAKAVLEAGYHLNAGIVVPEKKVKHDFECTDNEGYCTCGLEMWNIAIDEFIRLNGLKGE